MAASLRRVVGMLPRVLCSFQSQNIRQLPSSCTCNFISSINYGSRATNQHNNFHTSSGLKGGDYEWQDPKSEDEVVNIYYIDRDGERHDVRGKVGDNVMYLAHRYEIEIEGACEASLACCTCHVILPDEVYDKLGEPSEEEEDMLDLAPFLTETSRLGCQIILTKDMEGMEVKLPQATRNFYVDGHVPEPH